MKQFIKLIKNKNFTYLWGSAIFSQITINVLSFLILTRIFEKTNSSIATSFVWVAYALPAVLFGPFGAVTADVLSRKKILMVANLSQAICVFLYSLLYQRYFYLAYGVVFTYSMFNQFYVPAEAATLPSLVDKTLLPVANSVLFITVQAGLTIGFVLAGVLYDTLGFGISLALTSPLLLLAFLSIHRLPNKKAKDHISKDFEKGVKQFFDELFEGFAFIKSSMRILTPFLLVIGLQVSLSILVILMPVVAKEILLVKASITTIICVIPAAIGALMGTIMINKSFVQKIHRKNLIAASLVSLSISILTIGALVPLVPFWIGRTLAIAGFMVAGTSYVATLIPSLTFLQEVTPAHLLGRVFGNIWFITSISTVLPVLFAATVAELFGVGFVLSLVAAFGLVGASMLFLKNKKNNEI